MQKKHFFSFSFIILALAAGLLLLNSRSAKTNNPADICCKKTLKCEETPAKNSRNKGMENLVPQFPGSFLLSINCFF